MIGTPVRTAAVTNPPRPNRCSLYRWRVRLADALEALRKNRHQLPGGQQPFGVGIAGQRRSALAGDSDQHRCPEHQIAPSSRRCACAGVSSCSDADMAESIGPAPGCRPRPAEAAGARRRPRPGRAAVEQPRERIEDRVGELGVEAEVIDVVHPLMRWCRKAEHVGDPFLPDIRALDLHRGQYGGVAIGGRWRGVIRRLMPGPRSYPFV